MIEVSKNRRINLMSTTEPTKNPNLVELEKEYEFFDENLTLQTKKVKVSYETIAPVFPENATEEQKNAAIADANVRATIKLNELGKWQDAVNFLIRKEALTNARASAGVSSGINRAV